MCTNDTVYESIANLVFNNRIVADRRRDEELVFNVDEVLRHLNR